MKASDHQAATTYKHRRFGGGQEFDDRRRCRTRQDYETFIAERKAALGRMFAGSVWITKQ